MKKKNYLYILIFIEIQLILVMLIFSFFKLSELDSKIKMNNKFLYKVFQNKKMEDIQVVDFTDITIGVEDAPVSIIMYSKYDCSACSDFYLNTYKKLKENFIEPGLVKFTVRYMSHKSRKKSFYAVKCAYYSYENNVYEAYNNKINSLSFIDTDTLFLKQIVLNLVPDTVKFNNFIEDEHLSNSLFQKAIEARNAAITKTPTFIINGQILIGNRRYEKMEELINNEIENISCE